MGKRKEGVFIPIYRIKCDVKIKTNNPKTIRGIHTLTPPNIIKIETRDFETQGQR